MADFGYDVADDCDVDPVFGTLADLADLGARRRARGIPEDPEVEAAMHDTLRFWLDRGVDGFRIDVVHLLAKEPGCARAAAARRAQLRVPPPALGRRRVPALDRRLWEREEDGDRLLGAVTSRPGRRCSRQPASCSSIPTLPARPGRRRRSCSPRTRRSCSGLDAGVGVQWSPLREAAITRVAIYDTTLRDGTQAEGISLSLDDKLAIAHRLDELGFDYVEGGWPGSNPKDEQFFAAMAERPLRRARLTAFGSTRRRGVRAEDDPQLRLLVEARTPAVALVAKAWDFHVRVVLKTTPEENLAMIADSVRFLKEQGREVVLDAEHFFDGYRASPGYALAALHAAADAGADWLVLCDTNGGSLPEDVAAAVARVRAELSPAIGIHAHNDGELAVANSLAAVGAGATQVQGTVNGYGERTGNANLCSIVPNLALKLGAGCGVVVDRLTELSRFVDATAHVAPNRRLPYVGADAFAHKGGIHVHAVAADPATYEHVAPESVGNERHILISELSGRNNVLERARALGLELDGETAAAVVARVKELESEGFRFEDAEASFELLAHRAAPDYRPPFEAVSYTVRSHEDAGSAGSAEAAVELCVSGELVAGAGEGSGPVAALEAAVRDALGVAFPAVDGFALSGFRAEVLEGRAGRRGPVRVWTRGTSAGGGTWATVGSSTNLLEASWLALLDATEYAIARTPVAVEAA